MTVLTAEQRAELRHLAEQAVHHPPMSAAWLRYYGAIEPGIIIRLLDQIDAEAVRRDQEIWDAVRLPEPPP